MKKKVVNKKILENLVEFILGTSIIWLPVIGCIVAGWLSEIITMDMIMTVVYISIPILLFVLVICEISDSRAERRTRTHGKVR